jgi:hypothetical protein
MAEQQTSYVGAMLKSQGNLYAGLGSCVLAAIAAIPLGMAGAVVTLVMFAAGEAVASLFVPAMPTFRAKVDQDIRQEARSKVRGHLLAEIGRLIPLYTNGEYPLTVRRDARLSVEDRTRMSNYNSIIDRIQSISNISDDKRTAVGPREVEKLHEAALDFLSLWLVRLIMDKREEAVDIDDVVSHVREIDKQLAGANASLARQLNAARKQYSDLLARHSNMAGKSTAIDASLMGIPDKIEDIYQMILSSKFSSTIGAQLDDSLSRLQLDEALEQELNSEISMEIPDNILGLARPNRSVVAAKSQAAAASLTR